ncbi:MAG TPA: tetratricopeptide repeat protein [Armatimonadota bacterium]|nr:tetratricopeptide repeat protein [Armatimonadota bacterium]
MINQRISLAVASAILVLIMAAGALKVRYAVADRNYALAERVQGRDQVRRLERTLDLKPGLTVARRQLAADLESLGHYDRALTQIGLLIHSRDHGKTSLWDLREQQGEALYHLSKFQDAASALRLAILERPGAGVSHLYLGESYDGLGDTSAAENEYRIAIKRSPGDERAYLRLGALLVSRGQSAEAMDLAKQMTARGPELAMDWHRVIADNALRSGKPDVALHETRLAARANPKATWPLLQAAAILVSERKPAEAVHEASQAAKIAPADPTAALALASVLESDQQWDRSVEVYRAVEKRQPQAFARWVAAARGPQESNPAVVLWQEHLETTINPGDVHLMGPDSEPGIQQAWYAGDQGEHLLNTNTANALFLQGALAETRHDYTGAGQFFENALHYIPTAESTHNTPFTNHLREAIEGSIDAVLQTQISGSPVEQ